MCSLLHSTPVFFQFNFIVVELICNLNFCCIKKWSYVYMCVYIHKHIYIYIWRRTWPPTSVFLPGESHRQRSLAGYSPWCHSQTRLKWLSTYTYTCVYSLVTQTVKNLHVMQKNQVWSLGWKDPLETGMATHSSILAWRIPWTAESGGLQSMGVTESQT